jgi:4-amino-4-deoxy-L-arabinose transferase-like glycosyltransferase
VTATVPETDVPVRTDAAPAGAPPGRRVRVAFWTSPPDQPGWARPALLTVAAVATFAYAWRLGSSTEIFYAAADRSMSSSLHDFFFAAFDPAGTISIDKLPGAFWLQAVALRVFGAHTWSIALPQVVEGVLSVLVLYRVVRRSAGPSAGIVAAGLLAIAPATVTLDRGNVADTLLVLLLVLAADSMVAAVQTGSTVSLLMAGVWVGLAFQAKMLEAWLLLPVLLLAYLVAAPGPVVRRVVSGAAMLAVALVVSLSWMAVVSLTPQHDRPYVDGTTNDSVVSQVFDYNGFGRVGHLSPNQVLGTTLGIPVLATPTPAASATRLFTHSSGRDTGWLLVPALLLVPTLLWVRRRRRRADPVLAALLLWGGWLVVFGVVFSVSAINSYYLGGLSPPIAALLGVGAALAWEHRRLPEVQVAVVVLVAVTFTYAAWLLPSAGTGVSGSIVWVTAAIGLGAVGAIVAFAVTGTQAVARLAAVLAGGAMVVVPLVASVTVVTNDLGAFDTPFQPVAVTAFTKSFFGAPLQALSTLPSIERVREGAPDLFAAQTSVIAAPFIFATGEEALPVGGYDGAAPEPTLRQLRTDIARGEFHLFLGGPNPVDPRAQWIADHCLPVKPTGPPPPFPLVISYCLPSQAR